MDQSIAFVRAAHSGTIAPSGSATVVVDLSGSHRWRISVLNTGTSNAIDTVTVYESTVNDTVAEYVLDSASTSAFGSIAAATGGVDGQGVMDIVDEGFRYVKLILASTSGTTYTVIARGT